MASSFCDPDGMLRCRKSRKSRNHSTPSISVSSCDCNQMMENRQFGRYTTQLDDVKLLAERRLRTRLARWQIVRRLSAAIFPHHVPVTASNSLMQPSIDQRTLQSRRRRAKAVALMHNTHFGHLEAILSFWTIGESRECIYGV